MKKPQWLNYCMCVQPLLWGIQSLSNDDYKWRDCILCTYNRLTFLIFRIKIFFRGTYSYILMNDLKYHLLWCNRLKQDAPISPIIPSAFLTRVDRRSFPCSDSIGFLFYMWSFLERFSPYSAWRNMARQTSINMLDIFILIYKQVFILLIMSV